MSRFEACHAITARWEGGWSDHPLDPGGKTNWGITQATLSAYLGRPASAEDIRNLTKAQATEIYRRLYWTRVAGDQLPAGVDLCVYDFGVNSGPARAVLSLQAALKVKTDGWFGQKTAAALSTADLTTLINTLCDRRLAFLRSLPTFKTFGKGWTNRVEDIRKQALKMASGATIRPRIEPQEASMPKAEPPPPVEKFVTLTQLGGGLASVLALLTPFVDFWRNNADLLTQPLFLLVVVVLMGMGLYLTFRSNPPVESQM